MKMWLAFSRIDRDCADRAIRRDRAVDRTDRTAAQGAVEAVLPETSVQLLPKSVDL